MTESSSDQEQLLKLRKVLELAKAKQNKLFISNIEREIAALERGQPSPIIEEYLTVEERANAAEE
ncbi:MAG: hypothetical protein CL862_00225 [Cyanobium sp. NAT70]|nr:hypothetical protein [Cyanobium sp. NAT70]|tara:strand:+ start:693 stop:887 length:195 start_codon:yes stop_codon:yes gene_type:complete